MYILENPADYFLLGVGITTILFIVYFVSKKNEIEKQADYIRLLESENFENKANLQSQKYKILELEKEKRYMEKYNEEKLNEKLEKLEFSRISLESEKNKILKKEEEIYKKQEEKKYKLWTEHEENVISKIKNLAKKTEYNFSVFDNLNIPIDFEFNVKPDCMIEFLDQYVIFDAKKSKNPQTYIDAQVKQTAEKYSSQKSSELFEKIYSTIFFVMPESDISQLKKTEFQENGYTFLIISESQISSVFYFLKKISQYEKISNFNPQERENLIQLIASYDTHISYQNAVNFVLAKQSFALRKNKKLLPANFVSDVNIIQKKSKNKILNQSEILKYAKNQNIQKKEISDFIKPNPEISVDIMQETENLVKNIKIEHV